MNAVGFNLILSSMFFRIVSTLMVVLRLSRVYGVVSRFREVFFYEGLFYLVESIMNHFGVNTFEVRDAGFRVQFQSF